METAIAVAFVEVFKVTNFPNREMVLRYSDKRDFDAKSLT